MSLSITAQQTAPQSISTLSSPSEIETTLMLGLLIIMVTNAAVKLQPVNSEQPTSEVTEESKKSEEDEKAENLKRLALALASSRNDDNSLEKTNKEHLQLQPTSFSHNRTGSTKEEPSHVDPAEKLAEPSKITDINIQKERKQNEEKRKIDKQKAVEERINKGVITAETNKEIVAQQEAIKSGTNIPSGLMASQTVTSTNYTAPKKM